MTLYKDVYIYVPCSVLGSELKKKNSNKNNISSKLAFSYFLKFCNVVHFVLKFSIGNLLIDQNTVTKLFLILEDYKFLNKIFWLSCLGYLPHKILKLYGFPIFRLCVYLMKKKKYRDVPKVFGHCNFLLYISYKTTIFENIISKSILVRF